MPKPYVLCVDDDKTILEGLTLQLKDLLGRQFCYEIAESAEEALELIEELALGSEELALVVTDYWMQGQTGAWLILQLQERYPSTPMILLSGIEKKQIQELEQAATGSGLYIIPKPWEKKELQYILYQNFPAKNN
jgi:CheY-like chemotaxis protein